MQFEKNIATPLLFDEKISKSTLNDKSNKWDNSQIEDDQIKSQSTQAGLQINQKEFIGSFFSSERYRKGKKDTIGNPISTENMTGESFIQRLIHNEEKFYHKKLPKLQGQYHQCIPNPHQENQFITVQLVKKTVVGMSVSDNALFFNLDQEISG